MTEKRPTGTPLPHCLQCFASRIGLVVPGLPHVTGCDGTRPRALPECLEGCLFGSVAVIPVHLRCLFIQCSGLFTGCCRVKRAIAFQGDKVTSAYLDDASDHLHHVAQCRRRKKKAESYRYPRVPRGAFLVFMFPGVCTLQHSAFSPLVHLGKFQRGKRASR